MAKTKDANIYCSFHPPCVSCPVSVSTEAVDTRRRLNAVIHFISALAKKEQIKR